MRTSDFLYLLWGLVAGLSLSSCALDRKEQTSATASVRILAAPEALLIPIVSQMALLSTSVSSTLVLESYQVPLSSIDLIGAVGGRSQRIYSCSGESDDACRFDLTKSSNALYQSAEPIAVLSGSYRSVELNFCKDQPPQTEDDPTSWFEVLVKGSVQLALVPHFTHAGDGLSRIEPAEFTRLRIRGQCKVNLPLARELQLTAKAQTAITVVLDANASLTALNAAQTSNGCRTAQDTSSSLCARTIAAFATAGGESDALSLEHFRVRFSDTNGRQDFPESLISLYIKNDSAIWGASVAQVYRNTSIFTPSLREVLTVFSRSEIDPDGRVNLYGISPIDGAESLGFAKLSRSGKSSGNVRDNPFIGYEGAPLTWTAQRETFADKNGL